MLPVDVVPEGSGARPVPTPDAEPAVVLGPQPAIANKKTTVARTVIVRSPILDEYEVGNDTNTDSRLEVAVLSRIARWVAAVMTEVGACTGVPMHQPRSAV